MTPPDEAATTGIDPGTVEHVLGDHPVRVAVLFGSHVRGTANAGSDIDLAVEFDDSLSEEERHRARLDLIVDLMEALRVNDVDVTDLDGIRPAVGASALRTGVVLLGSHDRITELRERFEARATDRSHEERMRQFDELIERLEEAV